ncbi:ATP-dependent Clp protease proteolytic subunit, partial [Patescibacteria group bacterium]|nr:ATP-dependent Clp protease proteolytic subunit [Patescibacteria group bacterium]
KILKIKQTLIDMMVDATGQKKDQIEKDMDRDYWIKKKKKKKYGIVDGIITKRK